MDDSTTRTVTATTAPSISTIEKAASVSSSTRQSSTAAVLRAAWLGIGFLLVITAFNGVQGFVTTLYPKQGFNSLALLYLCFLISSIGAPFLTHRVNLGLIFLVSAAQYALFILGLLWGEVALFIFSALVGLAAGALWVHQGYYITVLSSNFGVPVGKLTSVFLTVFTANMIAGQIISLCLLSNGVPMSLLLYVMAAVAGVGAVVLFFLPRPIPPSSVIPSPAAADQQQQAASNNLSLSKQLAAMKRLALRRPLADAIPLILWNGSLGTFAFGNFGTFLPKSSPATLLPSMFLTYGILGTCLAPVWGRLYDRRGATPLVIGIAILAVLTYGLTYWCILKTDVSHAIWIAAMGCLGALDNATNSLINMSLAKWFPSGSDVSPAFGVYRTVFCIGFIVLALVSNFGAWQIILGLSHVLMVVTLVVFVIRIRSGREEVPVHGVADAAGVSKLAAASE
ncbi:hypothetical protein BCR44DRAFT_164898 [Catenaria anguillulae PL171]|uniref:UNC93-like protein MFSD11 n=1 Tax=Catenaria anguillulae PL171 TaxID=765915 RepID=A0A1Y2HLK4_9FUNG|nr:hypothetical protein BCR44DRAFT_164898 [Catenaria anguillulae PL171]